MISASGRGKAGLICVVIVISVLLLLLIIYSGPQSGIDSYLKQAGVFSGFWGILLLFRYGPFLYCCLRGGLERSQQPVRDTLSESLLTPTPALIVQEIRAAMRRLYGRRWTHKIRILLVTGTPADVGQLVPGLVEQLWQEDCGTLLVWGGDLNLAAESHWLMALRKLRYYPPDGIIWVTSAFDRLTSLNLPAPPSPLSDDSMDILSHAISRQMAVLGWQLPLYVWSLHPRAGQPEGRITQSVGCLLPAGCCAAVLAEQLKALSVALIPQGIQQICGSAPHHFLLSLANQLTCEPQSITEPLSVMLNPYRPLLLAGVMFSQPSPDIAPRVRHRWRMDKRWEILPASARTLPAGLRPQPLGINWQHVRSMSLVFVMLLSCVWMLLSFAGNYRLIRGTQQAIQASQQPGSLGERLRALLVLQKTLGRLQYYAEHGTPLYYRAGLNQNNVLRGVLWSYYHHDALPLLRDAAAAHLQQQLTRFIQLSPESPLREQRAATVWQQLKLYLMLTRPEHMNEEWFTTTLFADWSQRPGIKDSVWQGMAPLLLSFYSANLVKHPQWRLAEDQNMVSQVRALLVRLTGIRNSEAGQYQKMLASVAHLYADIQLEDLTGDTHVSRLFTTPAVIPGIFTRQAWEQSVQPAIKKVVKARQDEPDWVLSDSRQSSWQDASPERLEQQLTERYFSDFGRVWLAFLNSLRWQRVATLSEAIDQLTLVADVRQSPLVALMNTLSIQGRTGQGGKAIADTLVKSAKNLLANDNQNMIDQSIGIQGPLDATFGPVLALMDKNHVTNQTLDLQAYLTRVTQVRLRLQQVTDAADPQGMSRTLAQTVFQGKTVDLTETRDYGRLIAAGLGREWRGFGQALFVRPMEQAWQRVLTPAAESLNDQWRQGVVNDWNRLFGGRYPFHHSDSDVSLPLLAKFLNTDSGRIAQFIQRHLKGVLHREGSYWVPNRMHVSGLAFSPEFLRAINMLSDLADVAFTAGNAGICFELRPGTSAGVMQTDVIIDGQTLTYVNQMPQWKRFCWPADTGAAGASLYWISTQTGTRQYADMPGTWGWIRLLDKATVSPYAGTASSYSLNWKAPDGHDLSYILRTEAGEGPLSLLRLRYFRLPETIFTVSTPPSHLRMADPAQAY